METYKFSFNDKTYELSEDNCNYMMNDEEHPVIGVKNADILKILTQQEVNFDIEYYDQPCSNCLEGKKDKAKYFKFLEHHFYIYTKKGLFISGSPLKNTETDNSYIVSVIVCINCGEYSIEIEQCEV